MTPFLAASRKHFAAALGLHARAKAVSFGAAASPRLKSTLWQSNPPLIFLRSSGSLNIYSFSCTLLRNEESLAQAVRALLPVFRQHLQTSSVLAACARGQENGGVGYREGKSDTRRVDSHSRANNVFGFEI
jgi:hypothetical protein